MSDTIQSILKFMQREDHNGSWLEWLEEINNDESTFDSSYVINVLTEWYEDSNEQKYLNMINTVKSL